MRTINFEITGKESKYADIFVGESIADCTCIASKFYDEAHLHIDGSTMKKIVYKLISHDVDIMGFKDGTVIIVNKKIGKINVKRFNVKKESNVIKICEAYEAIYHFIIASPAADLA